MDLGKKLNVVNVVDTGIDDTVAADVAENVTVTAEEKQSVSA